jgi:adenylate cyclase, class 2
MKTEIEAKFLDVDVEALRVNMKKLGATLVHQESLTRQKVFDFPGFPLDKESAWLRLREENDEVSLTFKKWTKEGIEGMKETACPVDSFDQMEQVLLAIGMQVKSTQARTVEH